MKTFHVPIKIILTASCSVEAENMEAAIEKADNTMYWAYQAGAPEQHNTVSISDCEIEVDGEEIDLESFREEPEE